jgi:CheY-like chemotaxis protein
VVAVSLKKAYLVNERQLRAAGSVDCPECGAVIGAPAAPAAGPAPAPAVPRVPTGGAAAAALAPSPEPDATSEAVAEEVVCPRCQLHFMPRKGQAAPTDSSRPTVLVVEDQEYFREIARDALIERFEVRTASDFDSAWRELAAGGVELLVLDLTLGGEEQDGRRLLEQLRFKPCPILIFTSRDESEMYGSEWEELTALGADDMVLKGMQVGETLVRKACDLLSLETGETE